MRVLFLPGPTPVVDDLRAALQASHPGSEVEVCAPEAAPSTLQGRSDLDAVVVDGSALAPDAQWMIPLRAQRPNIPIAVIVAPGDAPGEARALLAGADATVPQAPGSLERIGSLLMRTRRRDADPERRDWHLWFAGRDTELRRAFAARLGRRVRLMSLSRDGKLVPMHDDPASATALVVDARDNGDDMLAGLQRVRELHPALATIVIADAAYHAAFLRMGADDCLPPDTDVERLLLAVERLSSHRELAAEVVALRARETRLRAVVEYLPEAVVLVASSRNVLAVNLAGLELLGAAEARHVIGRDLTPWLTAADDEDLGAFVDAVSSGTSRELNALTRHDRPRRVLLRAVPFQREPGKPASVLVTLRPVPEPAAVVADPPESPAHADVPAVATPLVDEAELEALRARVAELEEARTRLEALEAQEAARADTERQLREVATSLEHELEMERERSAQLAESLARREADAASAALLQPSITALEQALADEQARIAHLTSALEERHLRIDDMAAQLAASHAEREASEAAASSLRAALEEARAALSHAASAERERVAQVEELERGLAEARQTVERLLAEGAASAEGAAAQAQRLATLEQELADARASLSKAQEQLQAAEATAERVRVSEEAARAAEEAARAGEESARASEEAARAREAEAARRVAELEQALDEARQALAERHSAFESVTRQLTEREAEQAAHAERLRELERELAEAVAALAAAREQLHDREARVDEARAAEAAAAERASELQRTLDGVREEIDGLRAEAERQRAALDAAKAHAADVEARAASIEEALAAREAELERVRLEDEGLRTALSRLEREGGARIRALEQERDALRREVREWQAVRQELPALRNAQRQLVAMEGQIEESQRVRAQALALETEVAELRDARERAARLEAELSEVREQLAARPAPPARLEAAVDEETRWLLYDVASIGHLTTTPDARILGANDIAAQLLGHFSRDTLQASGRLPEPLLLAAGAFAHRPTRFEVCLQHGDDGPLHWMVGLATPHAGVPATVTWMLIDVSEQRLHARRSRFLRRMEAMTHVLSAATAESATLVERATPVLQAAATSLGSRDGLDVEGAQAALTRTQALLAQLAGFARKRARRVGVRDVRTLLDAAGPVLVHVAGEDVVCTIAPSEEPLHAALEDAEFEQFMTSLVMAGRDALPLGGRLTITTHGVNADTRDDTTFFTRPSVEVCMRAEGYGARMPENVAALHEAAGRLGATFTAELDAEGDLEITLRLARVFVTS